MVVTTPWYEPFGLTPLEAMACGRPSSAQPSAGSPHHRDGVTGYLVPPKDPQALADRLHHLLLDEALRLQMGRQARQRVLEGFTWTLVAERTARLYEDLLQTCDPVSPAITRMNRMRPSIRR